MNKKIQVKMEYWLFEQKNIKTTYVLHQIDASEKAIKVRDEYGNEDWLPKSQIEIKEVI